MIWGERREEEEEEEDVALFWWLEDMTVEVSPVRGRGGGQDCSLDPGFAVRGKRGVGSCKVVCETERLR